ncbi:MAG: CPBP family intramembrane metalloprotease [Chloroflexi bacterium]|nr:CPBP family intramembrane metalloprotease [Chloroflexota bacterium]
MDRHPLASFFLITFLATWGIAGLFFLFPDQIVALTRKQVDAYHPLFRIAASAPTFSAFLVILRVRGKPGLLAFLASYLDFAIRRRWYAYVFGGMVGFGLVLRFVETSWGLAVPILPFSWTSFIPFALYWPLFDPGPLGEEAGWRGFALPLLQRRFPPFWASAVLGTIWSIWHLPAFYVSTLNQSTLSFLLFLTSNIMLVMFMTSAYNATRGNLPLMIVIHWAYNLTGVFVSMDVFYFAAYGALFLAATLLMSRLRPATPMREPIPGWSRNNASVVAQS